MVAGSIRFSYFHELFGRLNLDPDDTITVLRRDRTIIMRTPFDLDIIGKNLADRRAGTPSNLKEADHMPASGRWIRPAALRLAQRHESVFVVVGKPCDAS